jgi:hypothetical protein
MCRSVTGLTMKLLMNAAEMASICASSRATRAMRRSSSILARSATLSPGGPERLALRRSATASFALGRTKSTWAEDPFARAMMVGTELGREGGALKTRYRAGVTSQVRVSEVVESGLEQIYQSVYPGHR